MELATPRYYSGNAKAASIIYAVCWFIAKLCKPLLSGITRATVYKL
jgi:hypothetical protein